MTNNINIIYFDIFIPANNNMTNNINIIYFDIIILVNNINNVRQLSNSCRTILI